MSIWKDTASALGSLYGLGGKPMMSRSVAEQKRLVSSTFRVGTWVMPLKLSLPIEGVKWLPLRKKFGSAYDEYSEPSKTATVMSVQPLRKTNAERTTDESSNELSTPSQMCLLLSS